MKIIEVVADAGHLDTLVGIAEQHQVLDFWQATNPEAKRQVLRMLVASGQLQTVLDALQHFLGAAERTRIAVLPVEAVLPRLDDDDRVQHGGTSREQLYFQVQRNARPDGHFVLLVVLSTVVAAIGLIKDNVAVIIGAMVIAPLLAPNLALALGTALGDRELITDSLYSNALGLALATALAALMGIAWPDQILSEEILARTDVGLDSVALALASGAAAALSLTSGLPSVLVGVMVAVALLPPTAVLGLMLGGGQTGLAGGAALLLAVNVVCVNLAAKGVLLVQGVRPRTWLEQRAARQSRWLSALLWLLSLVVLIVAISLREAGIAG